MAYRQVGIRDPAEEIDLAEVDDAYAYKELQHLEALGPVSDISPGGMHTCALRPNGAVRCWGYNNYGQIGIGSNTTQPDIAY